MLRHVARLHFSTSRAVARHYSTPAKLFTTTTTTTTSLRCLTSLAAIAPSRVLAAASVPAVATRRWCSSKSEAPTAVAGEAAQPPISLSVEDSPASKPSVAEQISGLSTEDQERIVAALQAPEKEKSSVMGGGGIGPADGDMVAAFTCGPCDYRMVKRFSKHAYTKGIVIVECPNCRAKHLLADNLGWLEDEARNIEDILREKGESFTRIGGTTGDFQVGGEGEMAAAESTSTPPPPPSASTKG